MRRNQPTHLADVAPGKTHQCGEPVGDVQQRLGDPSTALQQRAVHEGHPADPPLPVRSLEAESEWEGVPPGPGPETVLYLASSQRPVAAPGEGLGAVVGGVDDDAVPVVSQLPQRVGDVADRLVHRGHHGSQLSSGDVGHVAVRVDVGLGGLEGCVDGLEKKQESNISFCFFGDGPAWWYLQRQEQKEGSFSGLVALQDLSSSLGEERGGVFALLAPHHALAVVEVVAANSWAVARQVAGEERRAPESAGRVNLPG